MSSTGRSLKNLLRNKTRTFAVVLIIGLSICVYLSMSIVSGNISNDASDLAEGMDTTVTVRAAGTFGPMSGDAMNESVVPTIRTVSYVVNVQRLAVVMDRGDDSGTLQPGEFGGRPSMLMMQGIDPWGGIILNTGGTVEITSGRTIDEAETNAFVAIIGENYAATNSLAVGSTLDVNGTSIQVVGLFSSGNRFGDDAIIMPYETLKAARELEGPNTVYVKIDSIGNMESAEAALKTALGDEYDVVPATEVRGDFMQQNIDNIKANSQLSSIVALITASVVMVFVMVLITRERIKEIGILKAIGFKNSKIISQFLTESMALAVIGFVVGIAMTMVMGPYIANTVLGTSTTSNMPGGGMTFQGRPGGVGGMASATLDFSLSADLVVYTLVFAIVLGIIGAMYPVLRAIKLRPADALRYTE
ncbi:MAG: ABC transporter permease [Methanobacteriota archaeon]